MTHSKGQGQGHIHFDCEHLVNCDRLSKYYYGQNRQSINGFRTVYLHLTLVRSECQGHCHSQFDCENFNKTESCCISPYVRVYAAPSC